ncbi:MAG: FHA domain-containing protein [Pseudomonadota bacterium]
MAKIIISRDSIVLQEVVLHKERMTIGRHPQNDIVIDHRAVSGTHAAITTLLNDSVLEDLDSTNGTFVNGRRVSKQLLADRDLIAVAKFQLHFAAGAPRQAPPPPPPLDSLLATVEVQNGANAGKKLSLTKPVTTLGSPGVLVVVIARMADGYMVRHVDGSSLPLVNGEKIGKEPRLLVDGDILELTGTLMVFRLTPVP